MILPIVQSTVHTMSSRKYSMIPSRLEAELKRLGFLLIPDLVLPYEEYRPFTLRELSVLRHDRNLISFREIQEYKRRFTHTSRQILEQTFFICHNNLIHF